MNSRYRKKVSKLMEDFRKLNARIETMNEPSGEPVRDAIQLKELESAVSEFESSSMDLSAESREIYKLFGGKE